MYKLITFADQSDIYTHWNAAKGMKFYVCWAINITNLKRPELIKHPRQGLQNKTGVSNAIVAIKHRSKLATHREILTPFMANSYA